MQFSGDHFKAQERISSSRKEIVMDEEAVEVIEPAFVKNTRVGLDHMGAIKPVDPLFCASADKITFTDLGQVNEPFPFRIH